MEEFSGHSRPRTVVSGLILIFSALTAFWIGEGGTLFFEPLPGAAVLAGAVLAAAVFPGSRPKKALVAAACLVVGASVYIGGLHSYNCAFRECLKKAETVRVMINEYHEAEGKYPENLKQLRGRLPGRRILRPTIITYQRTQEGYDLKYNDWLVEMKATQEQPFMEVK
ncbi:hypothetical protein EG829_16745 [bacterium]|nr:hypothetical protein [bacterium]